MIDVIFFSLFFFLPAGVANMAPVFVQKIPLLRKWSTPIDMHRYLGEKRILGDHKTWRGLLSGIALAMLTVWFEKILFMQNPQWLGWSQIDYASISVLGLGFLLGFGALGADALKSLVKRQRGVRPGDSWFPFDQIDYILGASLATSFFYPLPLGFYLFSVILWVGLHMVVSYIGYLLRLKEKPI